MHNSTAWPPVAAPMHVLVVDDDAAIRSVIQITLADEGYRVTTATNGREALDRILKDRPAVVLLDLQMPVMDGWRLQASLHELGVNVPVVFMTAGYRARAEAERHQAAGYLAKPFDLDDLLRTVAHFAPPGRHYPEERE